MSVINDLAIAIVLLINLGVVLRVIFSVVALISNPDEATISKKRIMYAIIFCVVANGIYALKDLILMYYQ